jgi:putative nucleotidyltransferase with HDIG domain
MNMQFGRVMENPVVAHLIKDYSLAFMALHDQYTTGHCNEVANLATRAGREMGFDADGIEKIALAGHLHDLGKQGVPSSILSKPSKLTPSEFRLVQDHVQIGVELLNTVGFDPVVVRYVAEHHERLDGSGYPNGLRGDEISLGGQIIGVADVASALASKRTYRTAASKAELETFFAEDGASRYNPDIVRAILTHME